MLLRSTISNLLNTKMSLLSLIFLSAFLCSVLFLFFSTKKPKNGQKLPPGPRGLPILGSLHILGNLPHQTLCKLSKKYGPIMSLRLGNVPTIVISSPEAAELVLKTHDSVFCSRPTTQSSELFSYGTKAIAFTPYGSYWRNVRRICVSNLLSASKIESFAAMRRDKMDLMVERIKKSASENELVNLSKITFEVVENMTYKMMFGRVDFDDLHLKKIIHEVLRLAGAFNLSDFVPFLAPLDIQGVAKRMKELSKEIDVVLDKIIKRHEQDNVSNKTQKTDFLDILLSMLNQPIDFEEQENILTISHIKAIMLDLIAGAVDTSATAIEWTLSELLKNPNVMLRLQDETKNAIGMDHMVQETDLPKLPYLVMVIKENLRLHPVAPFLVPHESIRDCTLGGYFIPRKSRVLVNVWSIGRDKNVWSDDCDEFIPMRFDGKDIDFRGNDFRYTPFGSGRRGCPGIRLGLISVRFVIAQLVHCFDWKLPDGVIGEELDMSESFGLALPRANNLVAKPTYRLCSE